MCMLGTSRKLGGEEIQKQKQKKCVCLVQIGNHQEKKGRKLRSAPR